MIIDAPAENLFITGASGYLGRSILKNLDGGEFKNIYVLSRSGFSTDFVKEKNVYVVKGSLADWDNYQRYLTPSTSVIHCAAATGKCNKNEYYEVNTAGTNYLLKSSLENGVRKFLHVSTVAVNFKNIDNYHYAASKREAENLVTKSKIPYLILRPTLVLGKGAPQCNLLKRLACKNFLLLPSGGRNLVQPINVDDLAKSILSLLLHEKFKGETYEIGGNDIVTLKEFISRLNCRREKLIIPIPINLLGLVLQTLERAKLDFLPVSAGQLAFFKNDITAVPNNKSFDIRHRITNLVKDCLSCA